MAIEVITGVNGYGVEAVQTHEDGARIAVNEAHLEVRQQSQAGGTAGKIIAVYSPGSWLYTRIKGESAS